MNRSAAVPAAAGAGAGKRWEVGGVVGEGGRCGWDSRAPGAGAEIAAQSAFTMVEVALSLAIVAFALVAIIGVMPVGLNVQRDNREDTILSQDAALLIEAIRAGNASSNLTTVAANFIAITNAITPFPSTNITTADIVSRLCIPRWDTTNTVPANGPIGAYFRSMSGNMGDAVASPAVAFSYVVFAEVTNYVGDPNNPVHNYYLTNNLYEVKLTFRWPVYEPPAGQFPVNYGNGRLVLRTLVSGQLVLNGTGGHVFRGANFNGL